MEEAWNYKSVGHFMAAKLGYPAHEPREDRPSTVDTFMSMAIDAAKRSPDAQTQVGAVIVSPTGRVLSTGYNGYPRNIDYSCLPNTRPHKYPWFLHAEANAIAWCEKRPVGCILYTTSEMCNDCLMQAWQHGIEDIVEPIGHTNGCIDDEGRKVRELFLYLSGMSITQINIDHLTDGV